jgi:quercetin dioxygenase-like cupin family protein
MRFAACSTLLTILIFGALSQSGRAEDKMVHNTLATTKFANFPGLPTCMTGAVQSGDPSSGGSVILVKAATGCTVPWHWHTPTEQLMIVSGRAKAEMKDGSPVTVHAGDFVSMPSKNPHQFTCLAACTFFVASDAAFDIHYVDASGTEIPAEQALKKTSKMPAKKPAKKQ